MQQAFQYLYNSLSELYPEPEIKNISFLLIEKLSGFSRTQILINKSTVFSAEQRKQLISFTEKLKKNIPVQYVLGETEFYGLKFSVNESVLIPRPETEELVQWIIDENKNAPSLHILDIGTGSACIAIALKRNMSFANITAFDISEKALDTAKKNAEQNNVCINFEQVNILEENDFSQKWDVIVSNPPYIPEKEKINMHENVLQHEPAVALFVPNETPLLFYEKIALFALKHLNENGKLYFEIHFDSGERVVDLLQKLNFKNIELRKDIAGNNRMVKAELKTKSLFLI